MDCPTFKKNPDERETLQFILSTLQKKVASKVHEGLKNFLVHLKACNNVFPSSNEKPVIEEDKLLYTGLNSLLGVLLEENYPLETILLCGTCINTLLQQCISPVNFYSCVMHILQWIGTTKGLPRKDEDTEESLNPSFQFDMDIILEKDALISEIQIDEPCFPHLALLHGVLTALKPVSVGSSVKFLEQSFKLCAKLCYKNSFYHYHSLKLLLSWLKAFHMLLSSNTEDNNFLSKTRTFGVNSVVMSQIMDILDTSWENPIHGDAELVRNIFEILLELCVLEERACSGIEHDSFAKLLLEKTALMPWNMRKKYRIISGIVPYLSHNQVLTKMPDFPVKVFHKLEINSLVSAINESYRSIVNDMRQVFQNVTTHLLPWTCQNVTQAFDLLWKEIRMNSSENRWQAEAVMLYVARQVGKCSVSDVDYDLLLKMLCHQNDAVRIKALSFICTSPKKAELPSKMELDLMRSFIPYNLNVDSPSFRCQFIKQMDNFLLRIHDSSVTATFKLSKKADCQELPESLVQSIEFVDWLVYTLLSHLFPGACYQRRHAALLLLQNVFEFFQPQKGLKKPKSYMSDKTHLLTNYARSLGRWQFWTEAYVGHLLSCIFDVIDEVLSPHLLIPPWLSTFYFHYWMAFGFETDIGILASDIIEKNNGLEAFETLIKMPIPAALECLIHSALNLCNGPRFQDCSSGAVILRIVFVTCVIERGWRIEISVPVQSIDISQTDKRANAALCFLSCITGLITLQFDLARVDLLSAARHQPIHGLLLALRCCIINKKLSLECLLQDLPHETEALFIRCVELCANIIHFMLSILSSKSCSVENCAPSFEEMGEAIQSIVNGEFGEGGSDNLALSADYQLVLACCWISLKESCNLITDLANLMLSSEFSTLTYEKISEMFNFLVIVLTRCRHKGAIEGCSSALNRLTKQILKSRNAAFHEIPFVLIKTVLQNLEATASSSSVTRRSAGLALLIQAIVTAHTGPQENQLLKVTVDELMRIAKLPLPVKVNDQVDLPQAHALHILRALLSDNSLTKDIMPNLVSIIQLCVQGFSSTSWAICNGSLQLFGVICSRVLGQKKAKDSDEIQSSITINELFTRFPGLQEFLYEKLKVSVGKHLLGKSCPDLVPLLTMVSQLAPSSHQKSLDSLQEEFLDTVYILLSSHTWAIRCLAAKCMAILIGGKIMETKLLHYLEQLPAEDKENKMNSNLTHGLLMLIKNYLIIYETYLSSETLRMILDHLVKRKWLLNPSNSCYVVRMEFQKVIGQISRLETHASSDLYSPEYFKMDSSWKPGYAVLVREQITSIPPKLVISHFLNKSYMPYCNQDFLEGCLEVLLTNAEELAQKPYVETSYCKILEIAKLAKDGELPLRALQLFLKFLIKWIPLQNNNTHKLDNDHIEFLRSVITVVTSGRYSINTSALGMVVWSEVLIVELQSKTAREMAFDLNKWSSMILALSDPYQCEDTRMQMALTIKTAGATVLNKCVTFTEECMETILNLFEAALCLLQDEDTSIRHTVTPFCSHLCYSDSKGQGFVFQTSKAISVYFSWMVNNLAGNLSLIHFLWNKLQNEPNSLSELQNSLQSEHAQLFEQSDRNIYAEPIFMCYKLTAALKVCLEKLQSCDRIRWDKWLEKNVHHILSEVTTISPYLENLFHDNKSVWCLGPLSQPKPYHVLCRLACQVDVILQQAAHLSTPSDLTDAITKIKSETQLLQNIWLNLQPEGIS